VGDVSPVPQLLRGGYALSEPAERPVVVFTGEGELGQAEERVADAQPVAYAPPQGEPVLEAAPGPFAVALEEQDRPEEGVRLRRLPVLAGLAEERRHLLQVLPGSFEVAPFCRQETEAHGRVGIRLRVSADLPGELHELPG